MDGIIQIDHNHSEKFSEAIKHKVRSEESVLLMSIIAQAISLYLTTF